MAISGLFQSLGFSASVSPLTPPTFPGFNRGGYTGETGGIVHPREFVLNAAATQSLGTNLLSAMNRTGRIPVSAMTSGKVSGRAGGSNQTIVLNQNFSAPVDRFNASAREVANQTLETVSRGLR